MQRTRSTDGVEVALHDLGGTGEPVLLAHATGFAGRIWEPIAARLVAAGYHCFSFDARCHGATTTPPDASRSWHGVADDLLAAVDALGLDGGLAAGHSMGSSALLLASLRRPGAFRALYCYEPVTAPVDTDEPMKDEVLAEITLRRRDRFESIDAARANFASKPPFAAFEAASLEAYLTHCFVPDPDPAAPAGAITLACARTDESELYRLGRHHGLYEQLPAVTVPTTVAAGPREPGSPSSFAAGVVQLLPRARLWRHHELGHFGPQQDPAAIAGEIIRAWADPPAAGTHTPTDRGDVGERA